MKATDFVECLRKKCPTTQELERAGFPLESHQYIQKSYQAIRRIGGIFHDEYELVRLIEMYDCSSIKIGIIGFHPFAQRRSEIEVEVGLYEDSYPIIVIENRPLVEFSPTHKVPLGRTSERLLSALCELSGILKNGLFDIYPTEEEKRRVIELAGGESTGRLFIELMS